MKQAQAGASCFYWIAGLSVANSFLGILGAEIQFYVGLGTTRLLRAMIGGLFGVPMPNAGFEPMLLPALAIEIVLALSVAALGWAASRGLGAAFVIGAVLYAFDAVSFVIGQELPSILFHVLVLLVILQGYLSLRAARRDSQPSTEAKAPSSRWRLYAAAGAAPILFAPIALLAALAFVFDVDSMVREQVLARAAESLSVREQERLRTAFAAVDARFSEEGAIPNEDARRMNAAVGRILDKPSDETASREELLELLRAVEIAGAISTPEPSREHSGKVGEVSGSSTFDTPHAGATMVETGSFHFSYPGDWSVEEVSEPIVTLRLEEEDAMIVLQVDRRTTASRERVRWEDLPFYLTGCETYFEFATWGRFSGYGQVFDCLRRDTPMRAKVFAAEVEDGRILEVNEVYKPEDEQTVLQAEFTIQQSLEVDG